MPTKKEHAAARALGHRHYDALLEAQGGHCAICPQPPYARKYTVDHDHKTLQVRGLLCFRCNYIIGSRWGVTPEMLRAAADYLENPPAPAVLAALEADAE